MNGDNERKGRNEGDPKTMSARARGRRCGSVDATMSDPVAAATEAAEAASEVLDAV